MRDTLILEDVFGNVCEYNRKKKYNINKVYIFIFRQISK